MCIGHWGAFYVFSYRPTTCIQTCTVCWILIRNLEAELGGSRDLGFVASWCTSLFAIESQTAKVQTLCWCCFVCEGLGNATGDSLAVRLCVEKVGFEANELIEMIQGEVGEVQSFQRNTNLDHILGQMPLSALLGLISTREERFQPLLSEQVEFLRQRLKRWANFDSALVVPLGRTDLVNRGKTQILQVLGASESIPWKILFSCDKRNKFRRYKLSGLLAC